MQIQAVDAHTNRLIICFRLGRRRVGLWLLGAIAQLGERLLCTQEVGGSIPPGSTTSGLLFTGLGGRLYTNASCAWVCSSAG